MCARLRVCVYVWNHWLNFKINLSGNNLITSTSAHVTSILPVDDVKATINYLTLTKNADERERARERFNNVYVWNQRKCYYKMKVNERRHGMLVSAMSEQEREENWQHSSKWNWNGIQISHYVLYSCRIIYLWENPFICSSKPIPTKTRTAEQQI